MAFRLLEIVLCTHDICAGISVVWVMIFQVKFIYSEKATKFYEIFPLLLTVLVWPQWWSFAYVSQQGVDFSKKIRKITIIFWFYFHRCSQGPTKIRCHFWNKSCSILKLSKTVFYIKVVLNWYSSMKFFLEKFGSFWT